MNARRRAILRDGAVAALIVVVIAALAVLWFGGAGQ